MCTPRTTRMMQTQFAAAQPTMHASRCLFSLGYATLQYHRFGKTASEQCHTLVHCFSHVFASAYPNARHASLRFVTRIAHLLAVVCSSLSQAEQSPASPAKLNLHRPGISAPERHPTSLPISS